MSWRSRILVVLAPVSTACERAVPVETPSPSRPGPSFVVERGDDPVRSFAWDGRPAVPLHRCPPVLRVDLGGLGRTADTLVHLSFDEGVPGAAFDGPEDVGLPVSVAGGRGTFAEGRFGAALELAPGTTLELAAPIPSDALTVELWVRPADPAAPGTLLEVADRMRVRVRPDLRVAVTVPGLRFGELVSKEPLRAGEWSALGIAFGREPFPQVRMVIDGVAKGIGFESPPPDEAGARLVLGGAGFAGCIDDLRVRHYAATSDEMREVSEPPPFGAHELVLRRESGEERRATWHGIQLGAVARGEDLARGELWHAALRDGRLRWTPGHWTEIRPEVRPLARTTHPVVYVGEHRLLMYGGETRDSDVPPMRNTDDSWIFRTDLGTWERVITSSAPSPRCHQDAAYSPDHGLVLLVGGFRNDRGSYELANDVWLYDVAARDWRTVEPSGYGATPSANDTLVYDPRTRAFLHVTARGLSAFFPDLDRWVHLPQPSGLDADGAPLAGFQLWQSMSGGLDPASGKVFLFGGELTHGEHVFSDDTYRYDPATNTMTRLACPERPSARVRSGFAYDSKRGYFVLFGGVQDQRSQRAGDLWRFHPDELAWERVDSANTPSPRGGYYGMPYDPELDEFFLLCGRTGFTTFVNESWKLHLDDSAVGRVALVFARAELPPDPAWDLAAECPGDSRVSARFRLGPDPGRLGPWSAAFAGFPSPDDRFVLVELALHPGSGGEAPEVVSAGFVSAAAAGRR